MSETPNLPGNLDLDALMRQYIPGMAREASEDSASIGNAKSESNSGDKDSESSEDTGVNMMLDQLMALKGTSAFDACRMLIEKSRHLDLRKSRPVSYMCSGCNKKESSFTKPVSMKRCTRCNAVYYCNRDCQRRDWDKGGDLYGSLTHKQCCPEFKKDKDEFLNHPTAGSKVLCSLFPWADQHHESGVFFCTDFMVRNGVFGSSEVGYWALPNTTHTHLTGSDIHGFCNGAMLLKESLPKNGWHNLKPTEIPSGEPIQDDRPVQCWVDYIAARNLSTTSIAPLLLTDVLTIYQMLIHELKIHHYPPSGGGHSKPHYIVYVLGAERELNYLPLYEELAYLLPSGMDLELRFVSPAVKHLFKKSRASSYVNTCGDYVVDFTSSKNVRIRVSLDKMHKYYHDLPQSDPVPDAVVGLNAGLGAAYPTWEASITQLLYSRVPFCFSEYTGHGFRQAQLAVFPIWFERFNLLVMLRRLDVPKIRDPKLKVKLNPFHSIIARDMPSCLIPNLRNGYLLVHQPRSADELC